MSTWFRTYGFADVADGLSIGAYPLDAEDVAMLSWVGIERVLNLVEAEEYRPGEHELVAEALQAAGIEEARVNFTDFGGISPDALELAVTEATRWLEEGCQVYIHCRAGWQRSAAVAAGVVAVREGIGIDEALASIQARKPTAAPLPHQLDDLHGWWEVRGDSGAG